MQFSGLIFKISELSTQFAVRYFGSNGELVHFIPVCVFRNEYFVSVWTLKSLQAHKDTESSVFANFSYMKYWLEKKVLHKDPHFHVTWWPDTAAETHI